MCFISALCKKNKYGAMIIIERAKYTLAVFTRLLLRPHANAINEKINIHNICLIDCKWTTTESERVKESEFQHKTE